MLRSVHMCLPLGAAALVSLSACGGNTDKAPAAKPAAGAAIFDSAGCGGCHTLKAAGSTGQVGPNLDRLRPSAARVRTQVLSGGGAMPSFRGQLSSREIARVAAFVAGSAGKGSR